MPTGDPCPTYPLLVGYYGEHNLGDDALLTVLLQQLQHLSRPAEPLVTARDQEEVAGRFAVSTVDRTSLRAVLQGLAGASSLVLGGGSLLQDSTSFRSLLYYAALILAARLQGKPVLLWAQGLGPLRRRRSRLLVGALLARCTACSWRDAESQSLAQQLGWRANGAALGSDPVWSLAGEPWRGMGGPLLLCFRPTPLLEGDRWRPWLEALEQLAPERELLWLPLHAHQDRGLLDQLTHEGLLSASLAARSRELRPESPEEVIAAAASAGLVLAMRLHGLILAALGGAPVVALSYDPKVTAAAQALGCGLQELSSPPDPRTLLADWQARLDVAPDPTRLQQLREGVAVHRQLLEAHLR